MSTAAPLKTAASRLADAHADVGETSTPFYQQDDWTLYRSLSTLAQKAGVPVSQLPAVVAKELADNALDACGYCLFGLCEPNGFYIQDDGPGLRGTPEDIAALFSIRRPLVTSKLLRLPTRGALGNGLRVVAGAVLASGGTLSVETGRRVLRLEPQDDGRTQVTITGESERAGTRVEVQLGVALPATTAALHWAADAVLLAAGGETYKGKTSPHWYDEDGFFELLHAAGLRPVREVIAEFDGCSGAKAGVVACAFLGRAAASLDRAEAARLLATARAQAREVTPQRLGKIGPHAELGAGYGAAMGTVVLPAARGAHQARLPVVVEAWLDLASEAVKHDSHVACHVNVNRSPATSEVTGFYQRRTHELYFHGCGLVHIVAVGQRGPRSVVLNIQVPFMPRTTDGKAPDLEPFVELLAEATWKAAAGARRVAGPTRRRTIKEITWGAIPAAVSAASSQGRYRFSQRQLFYAIRPLIAPEIGEEPRYDTFTSVLTEYEDQKGRIVGLTRDPRGTLYHPHLGQEIALGTLAVERYRRPEWTFNKVLYCEKEGFFAILRSEQWPEHHDCALLTSKGQATRAAKDLLDLLGETAEDLLFFCIHDADAAGTTIYQALQEATRTRPGRRVQVINLGLEPWEAVVMDLPVEDVSYEKRQAVAGYVEAYGAARDEDWAEWLQTHRVELNALSTEAFLRWIDAKLADYDTGKVIPPAHVLEAHYTDEVHQALEDKIREQILVDADLDGRVETAYTELEETITRDTATLPATVASALAGTPVDQWSAPVETLARRRVEEGWS